MSSRDEDYKLKINIAHDDQVTEDILCDVYLPKRLTEPVELIVRPTAQQSRHLGWPFEFSISGEIKGFSGERSTLVRADKVYYKHGSTKHWGHEIADSVIVGEPIDLRITNFLRPDKNEENDKSTIKCSFWLTPNIMLQPVKSLIRSFTGEVTVNHVRNFEFTLQNGIHLSFNNHYRHMENDKGDMISFPELVAEFEIEDESGPPILSFEPIDDFLMLTSFSARQRCVSLGWETYSSSEVTRYYRRDITIPEIKKNHSFNDTLIDIKDFERFISIAYNSFVTTEEKDLLRQALYRSIGKERATFESNYLSLFSALETLVLLFRKSHDLEFIVNPNEWNDFRNEMKNFIKSHPLFSERKNKRKLLYEKLPELTRVSFYTAFNSFCDFYNIDLNDLWPIVNREEGISLSDLRNKIVHGDTFNPRQYRALMSAGEHLRWILERSILSVLCWPYAESKVSQNFLSKNMTMYKEWNEDRGILTE